MSFDITQFHLFFQVLLAAFLGALIGFEREHKKKEAGLRTFSLVALGSCFFTVVAVYFSSAQELHAFVQIDPGRVVQAVAVGIGFIGSGLIIQRKAQVEGLTTAAALWAAAAIGIGVGVKLYTLSILATLLTIIVLGSLRALELGVFGEEKEQKTNHES